MYIKRSRILYDAESGIFSGVPGSTCFCLCSSIMEAFLCSIFRSHYDFFADITEQTCFQDAGHGFETDGCHGVIHFNASCQIQDMAAVVCDKYSPVFLSSASV